jgi:hypothetical protein
MEASMETTISVIPADLAELKTRIDAWRANKKYKREEIPAELRKEVINMSRRFPPGIIRRILKLDPWRLIHSGKASIPTKTLRKKPQSAFFKLPSASLLPDTIAPASQNANPCRIQLERPDGSRLTVTMPSIDSAVLSSLCRDFLHS